VLDCHRCASTVLALGDNVDTGDSTVSGLNVPLSVTLVYERIIAGDRHPFARLSRAPDGDGLSLSLSMFAAASVTGHGGGASSVACSALCAGRHRVSMLLNSDSTRLCSEAGLAPRILGANLITAGQTLGSHRPHQQTGPTGYTARTPGQHRSHRPRHLRARNPPPKHWPSVP